LICSAQVPEGFPTDLIPDGAKVLSAITSTESGSPTQMVAFETSNDDKDMYDYYLDALPKAGEQYSYMITVQK
jgi:hypothetical protein